MNKAELIDVLAQKMGTDRPQATAALEHMLDTRFVRSTSYQRRRMWIRMNVTVAIRRIVTKIMAPMIC
jgi:hypothetical protein